MAGACAVNHCGVFHDFTRRNLLWYRFFSAFVLGAPAPFDKSIYLPSQEQKTFETCSEQLEVVVKHVFNDTQFRTVDIE